MLKDTSPFNSPSNSHRRLPVALLKRAGGFATAGVVTASLLGCATFNDKTGMNVPAPTSQAAGGALTGAAVGGGLGLIIGSTSGNAGEGLLVGSVAGGGLGAGIGAKLDSDERRAEAGKDGAVRRELRDETQQLNEFKNSNQDQTRSFYDAPVHQPVLNPERELTASARTSSVRSTSIAPAASLSASAPAAVSRPSAAGSARGRLGDELTYLNKPSGNRKAQPFAHGAELASGTSSSQPVSLAAIRKTPQPLQSNIRSDTSIDTNDSDPAGLKPVVQKEAGLATGQTAAGGLPPAASDAGKPDVSPSNGAAAKPPKDLSGCKDALKEAERGLHASSDADRLFYLRRAARLCPTEPSYHVELGKLYSTIGKNEDAKFELRQAIDLDPNNQIARDELSIIENAGNIGQ